MLVGIECNRLAMLRKVALQRLKICKGALRGDKAQLHQRAGRIVDKDQKRAGGRPILKPAVLRTVDLDQFANMLTAMTRLLDTPARGPRQPDAGLPHPSA